MSQNSGYSKVVNQINTNIQQKSGRFDSYQFSLLASLKESAKSDSKSDATSTTPDIYNGISKTQMAQYSVLKQHSGLSTLKNTFQQLKDKIDYSISKIEELGSIANGDTVDANISKEHAEELIERYTDSFSSYFPSVVEINIDMTKGISGNLSELYSGYSQGIAENITPNFLSDISAESLGLSDLSDNPQDILNALSGAIDKLSNMISHVEQSYSAAFSANIPNHPTASDSEISEMLSVYTTRVESGFYSGPEVLSFNPQSTELSEFIKIDADMLSNIKSIDIKT